MILRHFPGNGSESRGKMDFSCFHRENVLIHAKSSDVSYAEHAAPLSIKSCRKGREIYELNGVPIAVENDKYLLINNGELYASYILSNEEVESFCIFFRDGIEGEALAVFENSHETLLENPNDKSNWTMPLFQNLRQQNSMLSSLLSNLHKEVSAGQISQLWLDEQCDAFIEVLLGEQVKTLREIEKLPLIRQATRIEIYRRLCLAKDYIESCYDESVSLKQLSKIACLSPHHFLRLFKTAFRQTPHQYLTDVRLRKAIKLVKEENYSITEICFQVGFENLSSFTRLFKSRFNRSPQELRRAS